MADKMYDELSIKTADDNTKIIETNNNNDDDGYNTDNAFDENNYRIFFVSNKIDNIISPITTNPVHNNHASIHSISCLTGEGIAELEKAIGSAAATLLGANNNENSDNSSESAVITRERHRSHVKRCISHLDQFLGCDLPLDIAAEELRYLYVIYIIIWYIILLFLLYGMCYI